MNSNGQFALGLRGRNDLRPARSASSYWCLSGVLVLVHHCEWEYMTWLMAVQVPAVVRLYFPCRVGRKNVERVL